MGTTYNPLLQELRQTFRAGRTRPLQWRIDQLKGLIRLYDENIDALCEVGEESCLHT